MRQKLCAQPYKTRSADETSLLSTKRGSLASFQFQTESVTECTLYEAGGVWTPEGDGRRVSTHSRADWRQLPDDSNRVMCRKFAMHLSLLSIPSVRPLPTQIVRLIASFDSDDSIISTAVYITTVCWLHHTHYGHTPPPIWEPSIVMTMFFCLSDHKPRTTRLIFTKFLCMLSMAMARSSSGGVAISYVLPVYTG